MTPRGHRGLGPDGLGPLPVLTSPHRTPSSGELSRTLDSPGSPESQSRRELWLNLAGPGSHAETLEALRREAPALHPPAGPSSSRRPASGASRDGDSRPQPA